MLPRRSVPIKTGRWGLSLFRRSFTSETVGTGRGPGLGLVPPPPLSGSHALKMR